LSGVTWCVVVRSGDKVPIMQAHMLKDLYTANGHRHTSKSTGPTAKQQPNSSCDNSAAATCGVQSRQHIWAGSVAAYCGCCIGMGKPHAHGLAIAHFHHTRHLTTLDTV
jgi:hypothetical protein